MIVSGPMVPDLTGTYLFTGIYNGHRYYYNAAATAFLYWDFPFASQGWVISQTLGNTSSKYWTNAFAPTNSYPYGKNPYGPRLAAGNATVTEGA